MPDGRCFGGRPGSDQGQIFKSCSMPRSRCGGDQTCHPRLISSDTCSFAQRAVGISPQVLEMRCLIGGALLVCSDRMTAFDAAEVRLHPSCPHFESSLDIKGVLPSSRDRGFGHQRKSTTGAATLPDRIRDRLVQHFDLDSGPSRYHALCNVPVAGRGAGETWVQRTTETT